MLFNVKNRSASMVVYSIPEANIRREFAPGETKKIAKEELDQLSYQSGGRELMLNFLQIQSAEAREALNLKIEPEYNMSEEQIAELILKGSVDAFLDCLDFAPIGVIDLVKEFAVELPMTDTRKIDALLDKTGFDLNAALANKKAEEEEDAKPEVEAPARRVVVDTRVEGRRTDVNYEDAPAPAPATPKYKVTPTK